MSTAKWLGVGAAGVAAAYFLDPSSGARRRSRVHGAFDRASHSSRRRAVGALHDLEHRVHGFSSRTRPSTAERDVDDATIVERVRSRLGRVTGSIHGIRVSSDHGVVELTGRVLEEEAGRVLRTARATRGVREIVDALARHGRDTAASALARTPPIARRRPGYWAPGTRLAVGTSSALVALLGLYRRGVVGAALASIGVAGLVRSASNRSLGELTALRRPSRGIAIEKTFTIHAPVADVFRSLTDFEHFPRFSRHVESVERVDENRWRFTLVGLAGARARFDGVILETIPDELISWTTAEESEVDMTGSARFERRRPNETRVTVHLSYRPAAGFLPHEIASLFHADARHAIDEDIVRMHSLLEQGKASGREGQVALEDLATGPGR